MGKGNDDDDESWLKTVSKLVEMRHGNAKNSDVLNKFYKTRLDKGRPTFFMF